MLRELKVLSSRVSTEDGKKIQAHIDGLVADEKRLMTPPPVVQGCQAPPIPGTGVAHEKPATAAEFISVSDQQFDNIASAFACDLTRVAYFQWAGLAGGTVFPTSPAANEHKLSHFEPFNREGLQTVGSYYAERFASLLGKLKSRSDGGGTLLDNTLVVWFTEHMVRSGTHHRDNMAFILAGSCGGALRTGRYIKYQHRPTNDLFISLANAMGFANVADFGQKGISMGPLPDLI